jgi:phosphatidylglycerophosphatase A
MNNSHPKLFWGKFAFILLIQKRFASFQKKKDLPINWLDTTVGWYFLLFLVILQYHG